MFEYLRNDFFNANEWSNNFNGLPTPRQRWNEYGGTFGGPIKKDKLFFFADYQGSRFDLPASSSPKTTFTAANLTGNLTDTGVTLHYPGTTVVMPSNLTQATICGPGQKMGVNPCINGISSDGAEDRFRAAQAEPARPGQRHHQQPEQRGAELHARQSGRYQSGLCAHDERSFLRALLAAAHRQPDCEQRSVPIQRIGQQRLPAAAGGPRLHQDLNPTLVNDFRVGMNYFPAEANTQSLSTTAGANLIPGQPTQYLPGLSFASSKLGGALNGPFAFGTVDAPEIFHQTSIQSSDTAIWTHNAHTFRFGFQANRYRNNYVPATSSDGAAGQIGFNGTYTGYSEADFFLGLPSYMGYGLGFAGTVGQRNYAIGAFAQDDWRVSRKLTLNFGLRWQVFTPIYEVHDRMTNFNEYTGQIELAGQNGNSRALYNQYNGIANFLPRLGAAYSLDDKTVIRAAFSRTSFQEGTGEFNRLATNAPWNVDLVGQWGGVGSNGAIPTNQVTLDQGFGALGATSGCTVSNVTSAPAACFAGVRIHATDPNYRPAVSNQWNLTLQRQITNSFTVQAGYVGQHSDHMAAIYNMGQNILNPDGTSRPGPYLAGNPALLADGAGQKRLNIVHRHPELQRPADVRAGAAGARTELPVQLHVVEVPDEQPGLLRPLRQLGAGADHGRRGVPIVRLQHRAGLRPVRCGRDQCLQRLSQLRPAVRRRPPVQEREQSGECGAWRLALRHHRQRPRRTADFHDPVRQRSHRRILPAPAGLHRPVASDSVQGFRGRRLRLVQSADHGDSGSRQTRQLPHFE